MSKEQSTGQIFTFEEVIVANTARVIEDGNILRSEATGETLNFDREAPNFAADLKEFLEA